MEKFNFNEEAKKNEQSSFLKIKEGQNKIRVISRSAKRVSEYKGNPTIKFLTYVIDRTDGKIRIYSMPFSVLKMIGDLQLSEDYGFDGVPMPYDITVNATNAGTKEVNYSVTPARANTEITPEELEEINKLKPIEKVVEDLQKKDGEDTRLTTEVPELPEIDIDGENIKAEDLPF